MSYENTQCVCGDTKPTDTMLCDECVNAFIATPEMADYTNPLLSPEAQRIAAIRLLALARGRKRRAQ